MALTSAIQSAATWQDPIVSGATLSVINIAALILWCFDTSLLSLGSNLLIVCLVAKYLKQSFRVEQEKKHCPQDFDKSLGTVFTQAYEWPNFLLTELRVHSITEKVYCFAFGLAVVSWLNLTAGQTLWLALNIYIAYGAYQVFAPAEEIRQKISETKQLVQSTIPRSSNVQTKD